MDNININKDNYEEFVLEYFDKTLDPLSQKSFEAFLSQHPEIQNEVNNFEYIRIPKDASVLYQHKQNLLKPDYSLGFLTPAKWIGILLTIIGVTGFILWNSSSSENIISNEAKTEIAKTSQTQSLKSDQISQKEIKKQNTSLISEVQNKSEVDPNKNSINPEQIGENKNDELSNLKKETINHSTKNEKKALQKKAAADKKTEALKNRSKKLKQENSSTTKASNKSKAKTNDNQIFAQAEIKSPVIIPSKSLSEKQGAITNKAQKEDKNSINLGQDSSTVVVATINTNKNIAPEALVNLEDRKIEFLAYLELISPSSLSLQNKEETLYAIKEDELFDHLAFTFPKQRLPKKRFIGKLIFANISMALLPTYFQKNNI